MRLTTTAKDRHSPRAAERGGSVDAIATSAAMQSVNAGTCYSASTGSGGAWKYRMRAISGSSSASAVAAM